MVYKYDESGNKVVVGEYYKNGVPNLTTIFPNDPANTKKYLKKKRTARAGKLQKLYHTHDNAALVRKIFATFLLKVLDKVADGHLVLLPGKSDGYFALKPLVPQAVVAARKKGKLAGYDLISANYKVPRFVLDFGPRSRRKDIIIYAGKALKAKAATNAQAGKIPWTIINKQL